MAPHAYEAAACEEQRAPCLDAAVRGAARGTPAAWHSPARAAALVGSLSLLVLAALAWAAPRPLQPAGGGGLPPLRGLISGKAAAPDLGCPAEAPGPYAKCAGVKSGTACKYGLVKCPDGTEHYSQHAFCDAGAWITMMADVQCFPRACCRAATAKCLSCVAGQAMKDFCTSPGNLGVIGCRKFQARRHLRRRCPSKLPQAFSNCSGAGFRDMQCKYGKVLCPDGSKQYSAFASCEGGQWAVAMAMVKCPPKACCIEATAACLSCRAGLTTQEFCSAPAHVGVLGCKVATCPDASPKANTPCTGPPARETTCKYDRFTCPDGSEHYTTFAQCVKQSWNVAMADVMCEDTAPRLQASCPKARPNAFSACPTSMAKETCSYDSFTCPDGSQHYTTFAECLEGKWMIQMADVACGHHP